MSREQEESPPAAETLPLSDQIARFFSRTPIAVVGASADPSKYGHRCFRALLDKGFDAIPVNPRGGTILDHPVTEVLPRLPEAVRALNIITPPAVTAATIDRAIEQGITDLWIQPGAEEPDAIARAEAAGLSVIHGGPCILVALANWSPPER